MGQRSRLVQLLFFLIIFFDNILYPSAENQEWNPFGKPGSGAPLARSRSRGSQSQRWSSTGNLNNSPNSPVSLLCLHMLVKRNCMRVLCALCLVVAVLRDLIFAVYEHDVFGVDRLLCMGLTAHCCLSVRATALLRFSIIT